MSAKVRFFEGIRPFRLSIKQHEGWKLHEFKDLMPALRANLHSVGISGVLVDSRAAETTFGQHQAYFNAKLVTGLDLKSSLIDISAPHELGASFVTRKVQGENQDFLVILSKPEHIEQLGKKNLIARPLQPFLPLIAPAGPADVRPAEQMIRTREPGILPGKAIGHAVIFDRGRVAVPMRPAENYDVEAEMKRLDDAVKGSVAELREFYDERIKSGKMTKDDADSWFDMESVILEELVEKVKLIYGKDQAEIEEANINIPALKEFVLQEAIANPHVFNAEFYYSRVLSLTCEHFRTMKSTVLAEKADEIDLLGIEVIGKMLGGDYLAGLIEQIKTMKDAGHNVILIADYLGGKEVDKKLKGLLSGIVVNKWTETSHGAIVSKGILPGVVGPQIDFISEKRAGRGTLKDGDVIIIDGDQGFMIINPTKASVKDWMIKIADSEIMKEKLLSELALLPSRTKDGVSFNLQFNVEEVEKLDDKAMRTIMQGLETRDKGSGGMQIGLFRTEYLVADGKVPEVRDLVNIFSTVMEKAWSAVIRLPDLGVGTDKDFFGGGEQDREASIEMNPDLGIRGIRLLDRDEKYTETVKNMMEAVAIVNARLKASGKRSISLMVPMVTDTHDHEKVMVEALTDVKARVGTSANHDFSFPLIAMIEVPAAAIMADKILAKFDGASFGTNDFVQFVLAADRRNQGVDRIRDPLHPAVLRLMSNVVKEQRNNPSKTLSVCGVHAGDPLVSFVYMLMGIRNLSINPSDYIKVKKALTKIEITKYFGLFDELIDLSTPQAVRRHLMEKLSTDVLEALGIRES